MSFSVLVLPLLLASAPPAATASIDLCPKPTVTAQSATFKRLGDLPPAYATLAVLRSTQCPATVVLARDRLGPVPKIRR